MQTPAIRPISEADDLSVGAIIRAALLEYEAPVCGSALGDPEIDFMTRAYSKPRSAYFVACDDDIILGGAGIAPLENAAPETCELQKMYLSGSARGNGVGAALMAACLKQARDFGYAHCYLETFPTMDAAQKLYVRSGFRYLDEPKGGTGHTACSVWMQKNLSDED